jgi:hypothetical protein
MDYWYFPHCLGCIGCYKQKVESILLELLIIKRKEDCFYVTGKRSMGGHNLSYFRRHCNDFPQDT